MEQRFTQPSKRVLRYARDAARRMGHNYVGTEHILIGLLLEKEGEGGKSYVDWDLRTAMLCES